MTAETLFLLQKERFEREPPLTLKARKKRLRVLLKAIQQHASEIAVAIDKDFSYRPQEETFLLEILPVVRSLLYCLKHLHVWMRPSQREVPRYFLTAKATVVPMPLGVVGVIVPWNYPVYLSLIPIAYALAAGNRVLVKYSELSPHTEAFFNVFFDTIWGDDAPVSLVLDNETSRVQFSALPFGHLFFTGSSQIGRQIASQAIFKGTPLTLEMGGKSPVILSKSMHTAYWERLIIGKLFNGGQTCVAPDHLYVPLGAERECERAIQKVMAGQLQKMPYAAMISSQHYARLLTLVEDAKEKGGRIVWYGEPHEKRRYFPLCLVFDAKPTMRILQEEIFGPILPILTYDTLEALGRILSLLPKPLVIYYFGESREEKEYLFAHTVSGSLVVNDTLTQLAVHDLPFGGILESGVGQYHGKEGFLIFSQKKSCFIQGRLSLFRVCYPPYGRFVRWIVKLLSGICYEKH